MKEIKEKVARDKGEIQKKMNIEEKRRCQGNRQLREREKRNRREK